MKKNFLFYVLFLTFFYNLYAQTEGCNDCNAVLLGGVYKHRIKYGKQESLNEIKYFLAYSTFKEVKDFINAGGEINVNVIGVVGVDVKGEYTQDKHAKLQEALKKELSNTNWSINLERIIETDGDKNVLDAWVACKVACYKTKIELASIEETKLLYWYEAKDKNTFLLKVLWKPGTAQPSPLTHTSVTISDNYTIDGVFPPIPSNYATPIFIKRTDSSKSGRITVRFQNTMSFAEFIPAYIPHALVGHYAVFGTLDTFGKFAEIYEEDNGTLKAKNERSQTEYPSVKIEISGDVVIIPGWNLYNGQILEKGDIINLHSALWIKPKLLQYASEWEVYDENNKVGSQHAFVLDLGSVLYLKNEKGGDNPIKVMREAGAESFDVPGWNIKVTNFSQNKITFSNRTSWKKIGDTKSQTINMSFYQNK